MRNFQTFVCNSVNILRIDIERASAVCTHADLAVDGPGVEKTPFNQDMHNRLVLAKRHLDIAAAVLEHGTEEFSDD